MTQGSCPIVGLHADEEFVDLIEGLHQVPVQERSLERFMDLPTDQKIMVCRSLNPRSSVLLQLAAEEYQRRYHEEPQRKDRS